MRSQISFSLNGQPVDVSGADARLTLSDFLRRRRRLTGTKVVCAEGDCGACTVLCGRPEGLCGRPDGKDLSYRSIDSCITFVYQLDGVHVVTVEGLSLGEESAGRDSLHPVQLAMVQNFGSQCGFCTPGFVGAMTELAETHAELGTDLDEESLRRGLTGNLCRCTGYVQILEAGRQIDLKSLPRLRDLYDERAVLESLRRRCVGPAQVSLGQKRDDSASASSCSASSSGNASSESAVPPQSVAFLPRTSAEVVELLAAYPEARLVSGATDLGVQHNKGRLPPGDVIALNRVDELAQTLVDQHYLALGAGATWAQVEKDLASLFPEFARVLDLFGAPQIRNAGTVGGNLMNASPIADSIPFFLATDSVFQVLGPGGVRQIPANDFYLGYKETALVAGEFLVRILIPLAAASSFLRLVKVSRRRDLDISTFTAALRLDLDGQVIRSARVVLGGVGPVVLRLEETERLLEGETVSESLFRSAGKNARTEITPISDVRGTAANRLQLTENVLLKFWFELEAEATGQKLPSTGTVETFRPLAGSTGGAS